MRVLAGQARWTIILTTLGALVMLAIVGLFYATDQKPLAMRLMRALNPSNEMVSWLMQGARLNTFTARLYDFLVVIAMAFQGFLLGAAIDIVRRLRRPAS